MALLQLRGAVKGYGARTILEGLDFDIEPGARVGMIGPNGGGKSTLLRLLAGEEPLDAGELTPSAAASSSRICPSRWREMAAVPSRPSMPRAPISPSSSRSSARSRRSWALSEATSTG